jgi:hypothetical protein
LNALRVAKAMLAGEAGVDPAAFDRAIERADAEVDADARRALLEIPRLRAAYAEPEYVVKIRGSEVRYPTQVTTLSGTRQPRVAVPQDDEPGALVRFACSSTCPAVPVHRRRVPVQARGRGSQAHVRRRGRAGAHQPSASITCRTASRPSACRRPSTR